MLIRADGAGSSHGLLDWLTEQGSKRGRTLEYSVGFASTGKVRDAIAKLPTKVWTPAVDADEEVREGGDVAEITALMYLSSWPVGMRLIVRRERPHPGAQLSLIEETDGYRYQVVATNTPAGQLAFLEARHRAHARVEDRIRHAKDSGLGRFTSRDFAINTAWAQLAAISADLIAWLRLLALTPELDKAEPKALRYRLLHVAAKLTTGGRRRRLRIPRTGHGPTRSSPRSPRSPRYQHPAERAASAHPPDQGPRRTATRKRHPGPRHTHQPISRRPQTRWAQQRESGTS
jgi:hypothetical protein